MKKENLFVHVHIPKCGGTTFQKILKKNFGTGFRRVEGTIEGKKPLDLKKLIENDPKITCLSSHRLSLNLPSKVNNKKVITIAFVRNPVDRLISVLNTGQKNHECPEFKNYRLKEFIEEALINKKAPQVINFEIKYLTNLEGKKAIEKIESLMQNGQTFVFPLERFNEACVVLEKMFPEHFKNCVYARQNISIKSKKITKKDREKTGGFMKDDFKLLEISNNFLDELIDRHFESKKEFERTIDKFEERLKSYQTEMAIKWFFKVVNPIYVIKHRKKIKPFIERQYYNKIKKNE